MKITQLIGVKFERKGYKWAGSAIGNDGCLYAVPTPTFNSNYRRILKVDPSNDSTELVGPELKRGTEGWHGCITGPDGCIYGFPCKSSGYEMLKFDPISQEVTMLPTSPAWNYYSAVVGANNMIYFFSDIGTILRYDPLNQSKSIVSNERKREQLGGFNGAVMASDGYIYLIPFGSKRVRRFNPNDESYSFIGDEFVGRCKWRGGVLGPDGNVYGIPYDHDFMLKIDVATQTTSLVGGSDIGQERCKYSGGVVGQDKCICMVPSHAEFVLKFNPRTGITSTVGESLGHICNKYTGGMLASNGYIYFIPKGAKQVLKVKSWNNWLYLKPRLLVEQRRAVGRIIQSNDELNIVQHLIIHCNDDIFRTVLEMV